MKQLSRCFREENFYAPAGESHHSIAPTPQVYAYRYKFYLSYIEVTLLDTDKQALLNYLLGSGIQAEKPASHVIRQEQANYSQGNTKAIPVPTREEIEAQRRKEAEKAAAAAMPQSFAPMNWSQLGSAGQPKSAVNAATPAPKVTSPLWERVKTK